MTTSATGGYLTPASAPAVVEDDALVNFVQAWLVGITGLDPTLIRPRWQQEPANIPDETVNWCAVGIARSSRDTFAYEEQLPPIQGEGQLIKRTEEIAWLASFYGPQGRNYASVFSDGIQVAQNREILSLNYMGFISSDDIISMPELIKEKWYLRYDITFNIRRQIVREYNVLSILSATGTLNNEHYIEPLTATNTGV